MCSIEIEQCVVEELDALWEKDEDAVTLIEFILSELASDRNFLARMHNRRVRRMSTPDCEVDRLVELWAEGLNISRIKIWDIDGQLLPYRVICALDAAADCYHAIAVVYKKDGYNYERNSEVTRRFVARYHDLGLPTYRY